MFARVSKTQFDTSRLEDLIRLIRDDLLPQV